MTDRKQPAGRSSKIQVDIICR